MDRCGRATRHKLRNGANVERPLSADCDGIPDVRSGPIPDAHYLSRRTIQARRYQPTGAREWSTGIAIAIWTGATVWGGSARADASAAVACGRTTLAR